jgi:hypothetical protein
MNTKFSISVDPARDLVRIRMGGLFSIEDIADFLEARRAAHGQLRCGPNQHLTLNDISSMMIQQQEVVAAFRDVMAHPAYHSRRLAFVVPRTLARAQLKRALDGRPAECFEDPETAEAWLLAPSERAGRRVA